MFDWTITHQSDPAFDPKANGLAIYSENDKLTLTDINSYPDGVLSVEI